MGRFTKAARREVEEIDSKARSAISGLDPDGLVKWSREFITKSLEGWDDNVELIIFQNLASAEPQAALNLAKDHYRYHLALKSVVGDMRARGKLIPKPWRDYMTDLFLGIAKSPDGRGQTKVRNIARDHTICQCILLIVDHTNLRATRNSDTRSEPKVCAASIVAEASPDGLGYDAVELIWKNRSKWFRPLP